MATGSVGRVSALLRLSPAAMVAMDPDGRVTALNAAAERLLGTTTEEAVGRPYPEVFGPSLADRMVGLAMRVARAGASSEPQVVHATLPGGRRATLRATAGPLLDERGTLSGLIFVAEDQAEIEAAQQNAAESAAGQQKLKEALTRYVGEGVAGAAAAGPSLVGVGGVRQAISVLHGDVRGYTTVAEMIEPEQLMELLIRYHGQAVAALQGAGGMIDRFIGDAVLALWNAPAPQEDHTRMAIRGALALQRAAKAVGDDLTYGVGVHTGDAVVGNLGSERYMNYTAIGDTVNIAARLQSVAGSGTVVCSAAALHAAGPGVKATPLGELTVKGRKGTVEAYLVEGLEE